MLGTADDVEWLWGADSLQRGGSVEEKPTTQLLSPPGSSDRSRMLNEHLFPIVLSH